MPFPGSIPIEYVDAFGAGIYLLFGIMHADLWLRRRDRPSHFWLAAASSGALMVDVTGMMLRHVPPTRLILAVNHLGVAVVMISLVELVLSLGHRKSGWMTRAIYGIALASALAIGGLMSPQLVAPFLLLCGAMLLYALMLAVGGARAGDRESRAIAGGLVVLLLLLIADVLQLVGVIAFPPGMPIVGFATLFIVSASALSGRYDREHQELVALRVQLEERVSDRTRALEDANRRLAEISRTDELTDLPNRRGFLEVGDHENRRSARGGDPFALLMIDLDHFKRINDRYGHASGDVVLQRAASILRRSMRAQDVVARWGGEEFIVLLPDTDADGARVAAEHARKQLEATSFEFEGTREQVTASFGIAVHEPGRALDPTIESADAALYRAKQAGRNRVE